MLHVFCGWLCRRLAGNPVLIHELRSRMRSSRAYWALLAYLATLVLVLVVTYLDLAAGNRYDYLQDPSSVGPGLFGVLTAAQAVLIALLAPALTSGPRCCPAISGSLRSSRATSPPVKHDRLYPISTSRSGAHAPSVTGSARRCLAPSPAQPAPTASHGRCSRRTDPAWIWRTAAPGLAAVGYPWAACCRVGPPRETANPRAARRLAQRLRCRTATAEWIPPGACHPPLTPGQILKPGRGRSRWTVWKERCDPAVAPS